MTSRLRLPGRHGVLVAVSAAMMALTVATAFGTASSTPVYEGSFHDVVEQAALSGINRIEAPGHVHGRESRIRQGDNISSLLAHIGIEDEQAKAFLRDDAKAAIIARQLVPGRTVSAQVGADGTLQSLSFPLSGDKNVFLLVKRDAEILSADLIRPELETRLEMRTATIRHSLFGATDDADIPDSVAIQLADIFSGEIDFHRDLRKGDRFSVIYETEHHLAKTVRSQRVIAAEFINDGKTYRAFWYQDKDGKGGYYTEAGKSLRKAFLRSPLEFSRITSGFSNARYHPVLHETRAHHGIDYGAPTGTRVRATGDGTIALAGHQGGYGKVVMIRHAGDKTTVYGHLSGFAAGIRNGARVSQGEVIGFVGATGIATGPHLHYEFRVAGVHRNPLTIALPTAEPLSSTQWAVFRPRIGEMLERIGQISTSQVAMLD